MKKLLLILFLVVNLFALGGGDNFKNINSSYSKDLSIPSDHLKLVNKIIAELDIPLSANITKVRNEIYKHLKYVLRDNWYAKWRSNITPSNSRFKNSKVRFVDMAIINKNMILNLFLIHYPEANQIFVTRIENYLTTYDGALKQYNKYKNKPKQKEKQNTDTSAYLKKDGYMSSTLFLVKRPSGYYQYIDSFVIDTK